MNNTHKSRFPFILQLLLLVLLVFVLPAACMGIYGYNALDNKLAQSENERIESSGRSTLMLLESLDNLLGVTKTNSYWSDHLNAVINGDVEWITDNVLVATDVVPDLHFVASTDKTGAIVAQTGDVPEFSDQIQDSALLDRFNKDGDFSGLYKTSNGLAVIAVAPITDESGEQEPAGALIFGRILDGAALRDLKETVQADIALLPQGGPLISSDDSLQEGKLSVDLSKAMEDPDWKSFASYDLDGMKQIEIRMPFHDLTGRPLGVLLVGSPSEASSEVESTLLTVSLVSVIVLVVLLALFIIIMQRRFIHPLGQFGDMLRAISGGDLTLQVPERYLRRQDELGGIANFAETMIVSLRKLVGRISDSSRQVSSTAEQLSASSGQTSHAAGATAESISLISDEAIRQVERSTELAAAMEQVTSGMHRLDESSSYIASSARYAAQYAEQGNRTVQEVVRQMGVISESVHHSAETVRQLGERSEEIGQIVDLITQVAGQTNLLALNAAIEAARAGEQGRGFAVVAGEVRKLAAQAEEFAGRITELVRGIQQETRNAAEAMGEGTRESEQGLILVEEAGSAFETIYKAVREVSGHIEQAAAIASQISASTREASAAVAETADFAKASSERTMSVASSTQEQLASMQEITASSDWLKRISQELHSEIEKFKI